MTTSLFTRCLYPLSKTPYQVLYIYSGDTIVQAVVVEGQKLLDSPGVKHKVEGGGTVTYYAPDGYPDSTEHGVLKVVFGTSQTFHTVGCGGNVKM